MAFGLRQLLRWRLVGLVDRPAPIDGLFSLASDPRPLEKTLARWQAAYGFEASRLAPERETVREALNVLDLLETALERGDVRLGEAIDVLDVGARNWFYVRAMWALLRGYGGRPREVELTGLEVDPFVVYADGHSRYDWARLYARPLGKARFVAADFFEHDGRHDLVVVLFPFLNREEHLEMGLPLSLYRPRDFLAHCVGAVRPGGSLVVCCFDYEREALERAWEELGQQPVAAFSHTPVFAQTETRNFVTVLAL